MTSRGVNDVTITYSETDTLVGQDGDDNGTVLGSFNFTEGTGAPIAGELFDNTTPGFSPFTARYVRFDIFSNHFPSDLGVDNTVTFGSVITTPRAVFTDTEVTVNSILFDHSVAYAITGNGNVPLAGDSEVVPSITVSSGVYQFQVSVGLVNDTTADVANSSTLVFNNTLDLGGQKLNKIGDGNMAIRDDLVTGGGTLEIIQGTVSGNGTVGGDVSNNGGTLSPGNSPGVMEIEGQYAQGADGSLLIELAGAEAGLSHDVLVVGGTASLAGQLEVNLLDGFQPLLGDSFDILDLAALQGEFAQIMLPTLVDGLAWDVSALYNDVSLSVVSEPATLVLLMGMVILSLATTQRRADHAP